MNVRLLPTAEVNKKERRCLSFSIKEKGNETRFDERYYSRNVTLLG